MLELTFLAVAAISLVFTLASTHPLWDRETRIIWAGFAMLGWGLWGSQAGAVKAVGSSDPVTESYVSLIALGWIFAFVMFVMIAVNVLELIREQ